MKEIRITVLDIDFGDGFIHYEMFISNGITSTTIDFYGYGDEFLEFSNQLILFPQKITDEITFRLGGENSSTMNYAYQICLKIYCYENNGYSAIKVFIDNHGKTPFTNKVEFHITTLPSSINNLGSLLLNWKPILQKEISWSAE